MGLNFTIAVAPNITNIDRELQYIKSALLFADKITLISPVAYLYTQLTSSKNLDEKTIIKLLKFVLPFCKEQDKYEQDKATLDQLSAVFMSPKYKAIPLSQKLVARRPLAAILNEINLSLFKEIGETPCHELTSLLNSKQLELQKFEHSLADVDGCVSEYFGLLEKSVRSSFALFDQMSSDLMTAAVSAKIIRLSESDKRKITHAGLSDNIIQRLPSFDNASVDEILDIRKELNKPLVRFRGKMLSYSDNVQALPWDDDFKTECSLLYEKEIAPAVLEIEELTKENSFVKNLGRKIIDDGQFIKTAGNLVVGIAAANVIPAFTQAVSADTTIIATGGVWAATKIMAAYQDYNQKKSTIEKKDLFFYYQAGKMLGQ